LRPGESREVAAQQLLRDIADMAAIGCPLTTRDTRRLGEAVGDLISRVDIAEARAEIAQGIALKALRRPKAQTLEVAMDRAARAIAGRSSRELAADLDREMAEPGDDTVVADAPPDPDQIACVLRARRKIGIPQDSMIALADLCERWLELERKVDVAERTPGGMPAYDTLEALDAAQIAIQRAVRR
jgi:hypothetical protein